MNQKRKGEKEVRYMRSSSKWISLAVATCFLGGLLVSPVSARETFMDAEEIQASDVDLKPGPNLLREQEADSGEHQAADLTR